MARTKEERIFAFCVARHVMKCRRGEKCPVPVCRKLSDFEKDLMIQAYASSSAILHYTKCREVSGGSSNGHVRVNCLCGFIRAGMKELKKEYFHEFPMTLQLQAACAVPKGQILDPHPHREELLRLNNSAVRIQRRWRKHLLLRGPRYRATLCRYYMGRNGCRNGVNCTFAHGTHDLRHIFRQPSHAHEVSFIGNDVVENFLKEFQLRFPSMG